MLDSPPHQASGYSALDGVTVVVDSILSRCTPACGVEYFAIAPNPLSLDASHAVEMSGSTLDSCSTPIGFLSTFPTAHLGSAQANLPLAVCPEGGCDADNHRVVNDMDGTLTGLPLSSLIPM